MKRRALLKNSSAIAAAAVSLPAMSQSAEANWPTRPLTLVIPFPPGGGTDVLGRLLGERLQSALNQTVIIENKPGATGNVGAAHVAKATPDGYTLLMQGTVIGMYPFVFPQLGYDPLNDLDPISTVAETPNLLVVSATGPYKTYDNLLEAARKTTKPLNYGSPGTGSPQHLATELMAEQAGLKVQHIAYRGTAPALVDLVGGQTDFSVSTWSSALTFVQGGKLKALAVLAPKRSPLLPDVPAISELGIKDMDSSVRFLVLAPPKTPRTIIDRLNAATHKAVADPSFIKALNDSGYVEIPSTPEEARAMIKLEYDTWGPVVKRLGLENQ